MDEPRDYSAQWSKSEREKQILYINAYIWNLERWYWWTYLQGISGEQLEKEMATHSSVLAWRIPGTGKPGGLPSVGSHRVRHDWSDLVVVVESNRFLTMKNEEACQNSIQPCTLTGHYGASGPGPWALGDTVEWCLVTALSSGGRSRHTHR